jgi:peptide/nickel transport system substrate-binding protein
MRRSDNQGRRTSFERRGERHTRRSVLRGAVGVGTAVAGGGLLACGSKARPSTRTAATGAGQPGGTPLQGGMFNTATDKGPDTWDPHASVAAQTGNPMSYLASRLFRFRTGRDPKAKEDIDLENDLAVSAESPDALTWTVKLRPGAKFHDIAPVNGHAVEAQDIKATFTRALAPAAATRASLSMIDPSQIQTPSPDTVIFKLRTPYAEFLNQLASIKYSWILPREALAGSYDPAKQAIGSGPFIVDSYTPDVALSYKRNPSWYEAGLPHLDRVRTALIPDANTTIAQFTTGNLEDVFPSANDLDAIKRSNPQVSIVDHSGTNAILLWFPLGDPSSPFQDVRVRRAASMAIDRDALTKAVWNGKAEWEFQVPLKMGRWALKREDLPQDVLQYYRYNLADAKKLLEAAGGTGLNVQLWFFLPHVAEYTKTAQTIYNMLTALPWKITLVQKDYAKDWLGSGKGVRYGALPPDAMTVNGTDGLTNVDDFVYGYFYSTSPTSITRVKDPALDAMLDKARSLVNDDARLKAYKDIQVYLARQIYAAGTPFGESYIAVQPWVHGYYSNGLEGPGRMACAGAWLTKQ